MILKLLLLIKNHCKVKKQKRESKNSAAVPPAAAGRRPANMFRFQDVKVK